MLENDVRANRARLGWSQEELASRSGVSRAGISAIETGRLVPSTSAALALAAAMGTTVESLFRLPGTRASGDGEAWAWAPPSLPCRYWRAEVGGRVSLYPVEVSPLGLVPHDGTAHEGGRDDRDRSDPSRTLVVACCDPAAGLLAAELARQEEMRLLVLPRSSAAALDLLDRGLVHAAGVHLSRADAAEGNAPAIREKLGGSRAWNLLHVAGWDEGIVLDPGLGLGSIREVVAAQLRWVLREPGSGAQQCLDELLGPSGARRPTRGGPRAFDHRGVAGAIRGAGPTPGSACDWPATRPASGSSASGARPMTSACPSGSSPIPAPGPCCGSSGRRRIAGCSSISPDTRRRGPASCSPSTRPRADRARRAPRPDGAGVPPLTSTRSRLTMFGTSMDRDPRPVRITQMRKHRMRALICAASLLGILIRRRLDLQPRGCPGRGEAHDQADHGQAPQGGQGTVECREGRVEDRLARLGQARGRGEGHREARLVPAQGRGRPRATRRPTRSWPRPTRRTPRPSMRPPGRRISPRPRTPAKKLGTSCQACHKAHRPS